MTTATIRRDHPVREVFSGCSPHNGPNRYYKTKGHALRAFDAAFTAYGYRLDCSDDYDWSGSEGCREIDVYDSSGEHVGCIVFHYYLIQSGNYEFVAYLT